MASGTFLTLYSPAAFGNEDTLKTLFLDEVKFSHPGLNSSAHWHKRYRDKKNPSHLLTVF